MPWKFWNKSLLSIFFSFFPDRSQTDSKMRHLQVETEPNFEDLKPWNKNEFILYANVLPIKINISPDFDC